MTDSPEHVIRDMSRKTVNDVNNVLVRNLALLDGDPVGQLTILQAVAISVPAKMYSLLRMASGTLTFDEFMEDYEPKLRDYSITLGASSDKINAMLKELLDEDEPTKED
jgi:hypothetical protein